MSTFNAETASIFGPLTNTDTAAEPTISNLVGSVVDIFGLVGNTQREKIEPPMRKQLVVTEGNYRELALAEITRQNTEFGSQFDGGKIPVSKQAAIFEAFKLAAGVPGAIRQTDLDRLQKTQDELELGNQAKVFIKRAGNFAANATENVGNVVSFVSSPFGLVAVGAGVIVAAFFILR